MEVVETLFAYVAVLVLLLPVVIGLVEVIKRRLKGDILILVAIAIGLLLSISLYYAQYGAMATALDWFVAVVAGVIVGLASCGLYDLGDSRMPKLRPWNKQE